MKTSREDVQITTDVSYSSLESNELVEEARAN